MHTEIHFGVR